MFFNSQEKCILLCLYNMAPRLLAMPMTQIFPFGIHWEFTTVYIRYIGPIPDLPILPDVYGQGMLNLLEEIDRAKDKVQLPLLHEIPTKLSLLLAADERLLSNF